jgi:hypothetical protein
MSISHETSAPAVAPKAGRSRDGAANRESLLQTVAGAMREPATSGLGLFDVSGSSFLAKSLPYRWLRSDRPLTRQQEGDY